MIICGFVFFHNSALVRAVSPLVEVLACYSLLNKPLFSAGGFTRIPTKHTDIYKETNTHIRDVKNEEIFYTLNLETKRACLPKRSRANNAELRLNLSRSPQYMDVRTSGGKHRHIAEVSKTMPKVNNV